MATVTLDGVRKSYAGREVVHGVDCAIADGELMVVVGPSGCGKSTLLRMVAGLETITAGTVAIDNRVVNGVEPKDRDIAMVFQNYALYPHMTARENMEFSLGAAWVRQIPACGSTGRLRYSASLSCSADARASFPAVKHSASRWGARLCAVRRCFCLTSRFRTSTPNFACKCAAR